jgi:hypothetical protein
MAMATLSLSSTWVMTTRNSSPPKRPQMFDRRVLDFRT